MKIETTKPAGRQFKIEISEGELLIIHSLLANSFTALFDGKIKFPVNIHQMYDEVDKILDSPRALEFSIRAVEY